MNYLFPTHSFCLASVVCLLLTGCLPSSCRRIESQAISPTDSLSRSIAASILPDTLPTPNILRASHLTYPRTLIFDQSGRIYVSDTKSGKIFIFRSDGTFEVSFSLPNTDFPYLAGWRGDTLAVFDPQAHQFHFVVDTIQVVSITTAITSSNSLQYALANDSGLYLKAVTHDTTHFLWTISRSGEPIQETILHGSSWEHAGLLRNFENRLISLSGFYPWALTWTEDLSEGPDTLRWWGFDSPMLRRTFSFGQGRGRGAPLITSSAAVAGEFWFVLNQRAGWLRIDIYDTAGRLQYILIEKNPEYIKNFYPIDLTVKLDSDGSYHLAVALVAPESSVRVYIWTPKKHTYIP